MAAAAGKPPGRRGNNSADSSVCDHGSRSYGKDFRTYYRRSHNREGSGSLFKALFRFAHNSFMCLDGLAIVNVGAESVVASLYRETILVEGV
jgi:hypothetical protein